MKVHADMGVSLSSGQASSWRWWRWGVCCGSGCGWRPVRRGRFRLICEGWLPQDGLFVALGPLSNIERADGGVGAHSVIADPVVRAPAAALTPSGLCGFGLDVGLVGDLPDETREFAGNGNRDGGALLASGVVEGG